MVSTHQVSMATWSELDDKMTDTSQVLEDALIHGFVRMSRIALLVFDEGKMGF